MPDIAFEYSADVCNKVLKEITNAQAYIRIALFQIHKSDIFEVLHQRLSQGIKVEIFTLPYDAINDDVREAVTERFKNLEKAGAILYFCQWNVGDPERTTTATGRWYSYHGKMIITDKCAIALTANFTENPELDALLVFHDSPDEIRKFNEKFNQLLAWFVTPVGDFNGQIRSMIEAKVGNDISYFELPKNIPQARKWHWIKDYPADLCPTDISPSPGIYIAPLECRGRDFVEKIINNAEQFVYISSETFTDPDFPFFLNKIRINKKLEMKLLCGISSMDFTDRLNDTLRDMLAQEIAVRTPEEDIHGKLIITDKALVVSSINLNKMGLGFSRKKSLWRANTETILVNQDPVILDQAKAAFLKVFNSCSDVQKLLSKKMEPDVKDILRQVYGLKPEPEAREIMAKMMLERQMDVKRFPIELGRLVSLIAKKTNKENIAKNDILSALILHALQTRKMSAKELEQDLKKFDENVEIYKLTFGLESCNLIKKDNGLYDLNKGDAS